MIFTTRNLLKDILNAMNKTHPPQPGISHISELLGRIMADCRRPANDEMQQIQGTWEQMLSQSITRHAKPAALEKETLIIHVGSSTITQQLRFQTRAIIEQINRQMGYERVKDIRFKISNT